MAGYLGRPLPHPRNATRARPGDALRLVPPLTVNPPTAVPVQRVEEEDGVAIITGVETTGTIDPPDIYEITIGQTRILNQRCSTIQPSSTSALSALPCPHASCIAGSGL